MNTKTLASLAVTTALLGFTAPVHAAALQFGTGGIKFDRDTTVRFNFFQSQGHAISQLWVADANGNALSKLFAEKDIADPDYQSNNPYGLATNAWIGTAKNLTGPVTTTYTFLANQVYSLMLKATDNGRDIVPVYSTNALNPNGQRFVAFNTPGGTEGQNYDAMASMIETVGTLIPSLSNEAILNSKNPLQIAFNDLPRYVGETSNYWVDDRDYNDFIFTAQVPEPITMTGLALGISGMIAARRRRNQEKA